MVCCKIGMGAGPSVFRLCTIGYQVFCDTLGLNEVGQIKMVRCDSAVIPFREGQAPRWYQRNVEVGCQRKVGSEYEKQVRGNRGTGYETGWTQGEKDGHPSRPSCCLPPYPWIKRRVPP